MTKNSTFFFKHKVCLSLIVFSLFLIKSAAAHAGCTTIYGHGSHPSKVGAIGRAQLIVNAQVARSGRGGIVHRKVKCVLGRLYGRPLYSCSVKVRFCTLQGVQPRRRHSPIIR